MNKYLALVTFMCVAGVIGMRAVGANDHIHWEIFKRTFGKVYANSSEESFRRSLFLETKRRVERHNADSAKRLGFKLGFSHLSDWTSDELNRMNGLKYDADEFEFLAKQHQQENMPDFVKKIMEVDVKDLPKEVDWRKVAGRVSSVKDQGRCGSCWAFATTGVLEGQQQVATNATANGNLVPLSEQNLIDCSDECFGCNGGNIYYALEFVGQEKGIDSERDYPYLDVKGPVEHSCTFDSKRSLMNNVKGAMPISTNVGAEVNIQKFVAKFGPVAVAITGTQNLIDYKSGVLNDPLCKITAINHAVLLVGYGTDLQEGDYWIIKNSWGSQWGEEGYFRLARNKNMCCVACQGFIPNLGN